MIGHSSFSIERIRLESRATEGDSPVEQSRVGVIDRITESSYLGV